MNINPYYILKNFVICNTIISFACFESLDCPRLSKDSSHAELKTDNMQTKFSPYAHDSFVTKLYSIVGPHVNLADTLTSILNLSRQEIVNKLKGDASFSTEEMEAIREGFNNSTLGNISVA